MGSPKVYANRRESNNSTAPDAIKSSPSSLTFNWRAIWIGWIRNSCRVIVNRHFFFLPVEPYSFIMRFLHSCREWKQQRAVGGHDWLPKVNWIIRRQIASGFLIDLIIAGNQVQAGRGSVREKNVIQLDDRVKVKSGLRLHQHNPNNNGQQWTARARLNRN